MSSTLTAPDPSVSRSAWARRQRREQVCADIRWASVVGRDATADGSFVYAVHSTGVFCRPSCAARLALPEHVEFFASAVEAEQAGFRACLRCEPKLPPKTERQAALVAELCRWIEQAPQAPNLQQLAERAQLSVFHTQRLFKSVTGVTAKTYAKACQAQRLRQQLLTPATVTQSIYGTGFNSAAQFYAKTPELLGMTPTQFKTQGKRLNLRYAVTPCALGLALVAASDRGICAVLLGDDERSLVADVQQRFSSANWDNTSDAEFEAWVKAAVQALAMPAQASTLPLDIRGTAFQQRVWHALRQIPAGSTVSYTQLAAAMGEPQAVRAVAGACAANAHAVLIPCHRVLRSDGTLSGYRWGVERKQALLAQEAQTVHPSERAATRRKPRRAR